MGYLSKLNFVKNYLKSTFNSLYGIRSKNTIHSSILNKKLSIPFMGYLEGKWEEGIKQLHFQFPLWDTEVKELTENDLISLLSIPFMGYQKNVDVVYNKPVPTFNSLYGIHAVKPEESGSFLAAFQFPLWDTKIFIWLPSNTKTSFQFPLWDTFRNNDFVMVMARGVNFQFPLWDTNI